MDAERVSEILDEDELLQLALLRQMKGRQGVGLQGMISCENCGEANAREPCANKCMAVFYCSKECVRFNAPTHRRKCIIAKEKCIKEFKVNDAKELASDEEDDEDSSGEESGGSTDTEDEEEESEDDQLMQRAISQMGTRKKSSEKSMAEEVPNKEPKERKRRKKKKKKGSGGLADFSRQELALEFLKYIEGDDELARRLAAKIQEKISESPAREELVATENKQANNGSSATSVAEAPEDTGKTRLLELLELSKEKGLGSQMSSEPQTVPLPTPPHMTKKRQEERASLQSFDVSYPTEKRQERAQEKDLQLIKSSNNSAISHLRICILESEDARVRWVPGPDQYPMVGAVLDNCPMPVRTGDILTHINGSPTQKLSLLSLAQLLQTLKRPAILRFKVQREIEADDYREYTLYWVEGLTLGVSIKGENCGDLSVVFVNRVTGSAPQSMAKLAHILPGDIVTAINGQSALDMGYEGCIRALKQGPPAVITLYGRGSSKPTNETEEPKSPASADLSAGWSPGGSQGAMQGRSGEQSSKEKEIGQEEEGKRGKEQIAKTAQQPLERKMQEGGENRDRIQGMESKAEEKRPQPETQQQQAHLSVAPRKLFLQGETESFSSFASPQSSSALQLPPPLSPPEPKRSHRAVERVTTDQASASPSPARSGATPLSSAKSASSSTRRIVVYEVVWDDGPLGLTFIADDAEEFPIVKRKTGKSTCQSLEVIVPGDQLIGIGDVPLSRFDPKTNLEKLKKVAKPIKLTLRRCPLPSSSYPLSSSSSPSPSPSLPLEATRSPAYQGMEPQAASVSSPFQTSADKRSPAASHSSRNLHSSSLHSSSSSFSSSSPYSSFSTAPVASQSTLAAQLQSLQLASELTRPAPRTEYILQWNDGVLGITFGWAQGKIFIKKAHRVGAALFLPPSAEGDRLLAVNDDKVRGMSFEQTIQMLRTTPKPCRLRFRHDQLSDGDVEENRTQERASPDKAPVSSSLSPSMFQQAGSAPYVSLAPENPVSSSLSEAAKPSEGGDPLEYNLVWNDGPLGLTFHPSEAHNGVPCIKALHGVGASSSFTLENVGDFLVAVNGRRVDHLLFEDAMNMLRSMPKPMVLSFQSKGSLPL